MGWGGRRRAALGGGAVLLLLLASTFIAGPPAEGAPTASAATEAQSEARAAKVRLAAQMAIALGTAAIGVGGSEESGEPGQALLASVGSPLFVPSEGSAPPSWALVAAIAPLGAMAALMLFLRPLPTLHLAGSLYSVATSRGPPPPLLSAFLRLVAIGLLGVGLVSPLLFEPLLLASAGLLAVSLALSPGPVAA